MKKSLENAEKSSIFKGFLLSKGYKKDIFAFLADDFEPA